MDNVPSSAILAIVAIVAACLLGAFIFTTVQSQKESGNQAIAKTEAMNTSLDESTYTQYDGATVTGSQVLSAIKLMKDDGVAVIVNNGTAETSYLRQLTGVTTTPAGGKATVKVETTGVELADAAQDKDAADNGKAPTGSKATSGAYSDLIKEAKNKSDPASYITPSANYTGTIVRSSTNGSIIGVVFCKQ